MSDNHISIIPASPAHVGRVANRLRDADLIEIGAKGRSAKSALRLSLGASCWACTVKLDGEPHAMFGVASISAIEDRGRAWFLGSDRVYDHGREFVRRGPAIVALMHNSFRRLENVVSADNDRAIRLLRHWGFVVEREQFVVGGVPFVGFWRVANV